MPSLTVRLLVNERLRHAAIAIVVAAIVAFATILRPLDISIWAVQSKLFSRAPSGQIVLVTDRSQQLDTSPINLNDTIRKSIDRLAEADARLIVVGPALQQSGSSEVDEVLRQSLERNSGRIYLARAVRHYIDNNRQLDIGSPFFEQGMRIASSDVQPDFLGFVWGIEAIYSDGTMSYPSVWNAISAHAQANKAIFPDYTIETSQLPHVDVAELASGDSASAQAVRDKVAVIWLPRHDRRMLKVPNTSQDDVSAGLIQILAAETAMRGTGKSIGSWFTVPVFGLSLLIGLALIHRRRKRHMFYAIWLLSIAATVVLAAVEGIRVVLSAPFLVAALYSIMRVAYNYRRRHIYIDQRSQLPNFAALCRDLECLNDSDDFVIVVVKIARLDAVFATLGRYEQMQYLRRIAARLTLGDAKQTIYHDGGKNFSFLILAADYPDLKAHLEGLRAVSSQAIVISRRPLDVSMTIGADLSKGGMPSSRISSAIAAADQAREAYRPVFIITNFEADSEAWDYSLQSRLEDALTEDRISIKLQPLIELQSGQIIGAEALARWSDKERGAISPAQFILQCERVGRLDELTKRVLSRSFAASRLLEEKGMPARVSINVSAIQFVDHRIADIIEAKLAKSKVNPENILIEITESARIEEFTIAREIMERIGKSGIRFSIDDFGISSANYDALYKLPFSEMKIDRLFVGNMATDPNARAIVESMLSLSRNLKLVSVAEGIEEETSLDMLREMGGELGQGYFIARPQTLPALMEIIRLQRDGGLWRMGNG